MEIIAEQPAGENKAKWSGGLIKCNGYFYVYSPSHPNKNKMGKGYVKRSRLVMEKKLGRYLRRDEFVHHIDGNRGNDDPENLRLTTLSEHQRHHQKETVKLMVRGKNGRFERRA